MAWQPEAIRLYAICKAMNWAHLPVAGGIYDQDPRLLEAWIPIFEREAAKEAAERDKETRK